MPANHHNNNNTNPCRSIVPALPSAPRLQDICSYGCEQGCDVVFLVGEDESDTWRIPAHQAVLRNSASPVFQAMFSEVWEHEEGSGGGDECIVRVTDVDGRAFDNLLLHFYNPSHPLGLYSIDVALRTLYAAHKYRCPTLVRICVDHLNKNLQLSNILQILSYIPLFCGNLENLDNCGREQLMIMDVKEKEEQQDPATSMSLVLLTDEPDVIEGECARLLQSCLNFVDKQAASVLSLVEIEDLDVSTLRLILKRDTLNLEDERGVFSAILKWADKECKRRHLPLTQESKRLVLGDLLYLPRYLTMTLDSFWSGPVKSELFTKEEAACLTLLIKEKGRRSSDELATLVQIPSALRPFLRVMSRPRKIRRSSLANSQLSPRKGRRGNLIERWNQGRRRSLRCCRIIKCFCPHSNSSSPTSSPRRRASLVREEEQNKKWDVCVERAVVFLACLFD